MDNEKVGPARWVIDIGSLEVNAAYIAILGYIIGCLTVVAILGCFCKKQLGLERLRHAGLGDDSEDVEMDEVNINAGNKRRVSHFQAKNQENLEPQMRLVTDSSTHNLGELNDLTVEQEDKMLSQLNLSYRDDAGALSAPNKPRSGSKISVVPEEKNWKPPEMNHVYHEKVHVTELQRQKQRAAAAKITLQVTEKETGNAKFGAYTKKVNYYGHRLSLLMPVLFHFLDMATDLGVLFDWLPNADWSDLNAECAPHSGINLDTKQCYVINTANYILASLAAMLLYRLVSGFMYASRFGRATGILQFLDIMLFFEVYASRVGKRTRTTVQLRWIRRMESVFESAPQAVIQLVYTLTKNGAKISLFIQASLLFSVLSICSSVVKSDEWKFKSDNGSNQMLPPHPRFIARAVFRLCEVLSRLCCLALLTQTIGLIPTMVLLGVELIFYFIMYRDKFLGDDIGNVVEILVLHPNLSLRVNPDEHSDPVFGCMVRSILCWTPIACLYLSYNRVKMVFCPNDEERARQQSNDDEESSRFRRLRQNYGGAEEKRRDVGACCGSCINRNLVTVHFSHRFVVQFAQLLIIFIFFNEQLRYFRETMFAVATFCTILTPCLYLMVGRWVIVGESGLEMNVFGFLHQAHEVDEINLLMEFVFRIPKCVNDQNEMHRTPIMETLAIEDISLFQFFVKQKKTDLHLTDADDKQIIHYVAEHGDLRYLNPLLQARSKAQEKKNRLRQQNGKERQISNCELKIFDINAQWAFKKTPLIICAEKGHWECFKALLDAGADYNHIDGRGRTCLHYAIFGESKTKNWVDLQTGDIDLEKQHQNQDFTNMVNRLLMLDDINLECADQKRKWTPMLQAVGGGTLDVVQQLVNRGASLEGIDVKGESLLHVAVRYNQADVLAYLLTENGNKKWNLNHKNADGDTPLKLAIYGKYEQCLRILSVFESRKSLMKALLLAVKTNAPDLVKYLLKECNIDPNFPDKDHMTPLRWAAFYGYSDVLKALLIFGARDELDQFGQNIVFYAAKNENIECLELLRKANADFNIINNEGHTAIDKAPQGSETQKFIKAVRKKMQQQQAAQPQMVQNQYYAMQHMQQQMQQIQQMQQMQQMQQYQQMQQNQQQQQQNYGNQNYGNQNYSNQNNYFRD